MADPIVKAIVDQARHSSDPGCARCGNDPTSYITVSGRVVCYTCFKVEAQAMVRKYVRDREK